MKFRVMLLLMRGIEEEMRRLKAVIIVEAKRQLYLTSMPVKQIA